MTPLSDERLAQLRERWERGDAVGWDEAVDTIGEAVQAIAELIEEVERLRSELAAIPGPWESNRMFIAERDDLRARNAELVDLLERVQWGNTGACPECHALPPRHAPACVLAAALRGEDGE